MDFERVLVLSPHADDAELGCGGSVLKFIEDKKDVFWVVFSTCEESLPKGMSKDTLKNEFLKVTKKIGLREDRKEIFNFKVRHLYENRQNVLEELIKLRQRFSPDIVIMPSINDFHQDHQVVANETIRAFKTNASIIGYELPWNHITFNTTLFITLEKKHVNKKYELLKTYESQFRKNRLYFSKEAVFGLAKIRGVQCNKDYAEAFEVIRWMI